MRLANCAADLGLTDEAKSAFTRAIEIDDRSALALASLGRLAIHSRDYEAAEGYLTRACAVEERASSLSALGVVLRNLGRTSEAEEACRRAILLDSNTEEAHFNLGVILRNDRPSEAQALFTKALELDPEYAPAHRELGWLLFKCGTHDEETEGHFRKAVELDPDDAWAHMYLGSYLWGHDVDSALAEFHAARELEPEWSAPLWSLGNIHELVVEDFDSARSFFEQALRLDPEDVVALTSFGRLCKKRGQLDLAKHYLGRVLLLDPEYDKARALLAAIDSESKL